MAPINGALAKVLSLRGVNFEWEEAANRGPGLQMGFIAQEAEAVIPEVVARRGGKGLYGMQYAPITALLVEAVKDQQRVIERQASEIETLREEVQAIKRVIEMTGVVTAHLDQ